ncbi:MAG: hypothetical protein AAFR29_09575 [Pseudomonadota bacterium]
MKNLALFVAALMMFATGCVSPSERNRFQLEAANQICSVAALAEEKQALLTSSNDKRKSIAPNQNKYGTYTEENRTILAQKLGAYDAEVEATYRMATQSCTAYNRCLERNGHKETQCLRTESMWSQAQQRFSSLAIDLKVIEADLEQERIKAARKRSQHPRRYHPSKKRCCAPSYACGYDHCERPPYNPPRPPLSCCDTVNNIFTDCCVR